MHALNPEMGAAPLPNTTCLHPSHTARSALHRVRLHVSTTMSRGSMNFCESLGRLPAIEPGRGDSADEEPASPQWNTVAMKLT